MKWGGRQGNGAVSLIENSALSELLLLNICVQFNPPPHPTPPPPPHPPPPRPNPPPPAPRRSSLQPPQVKLSCTAYGRQSADHLRVHKRVSLHGTT